MNDAKKNEMKLLQHEKHYGTKPGLNKRIIWGGGRRLRGWQKDKYRSYSYKKDPLFNGKETTITITITLDSDSSLNEKKGRIRNDGFGWLCGLAQSKTRSQLVRAGVNDVMSSFHGDQLNDQTRAADCKYPRKMESRTNKIWVSDLLLRNQIYPPFPMMRCVAFVS